MRILIVLCFSIFVMNGQALRKITNLKRAGVKNREPYLLLVQEWSPHKNPSLSFQNLKKLPGKICLLYGFNLYVKYKIILKILRSFWMSFFYYTCRGNYFISKCIFGDTLIRVKYRSSHPEVFCKKGVLRNFAKFTGKHLCQSFFF